jgi:ubiquinol-cytochrome c reductase cytochrome c1 subunit
MRNLFINIIIILSVFTAHASEEEKELKQTKWPFEGIFGKVDIQSAQRGFQVYKEVCATCHKLDHLYFRNLETPEGKDEAEKHQFEKIGLGFSADEVKSYAAEHTLPDTDDDGQPSERKALPSDKFVGPYPNEKAARASNNGALPPDLSLIIKSRHDGPNYVYSLLTGYTAAPAGVIVPDTHYYNEYFSGNLISMPPPLHDGAVNYADGTKASVEQMAYDVVNFLQWAAEPEMMQRKAMGIKVLSYLIIMTFLLYLAKRKIWSNIYKNIDEN